MSATDPGRTRGQEGFTLIDMLFVVALIGLLSSLAVPGLMRARSSAQSSSALGTIRVVASSQLSYAVACGQGFYGPDFPALTAAPPGGQPFLAPEWATGPTFVRAGYNFSMAGTPHVGAPATCNGLAAGSAVPAYALVADPLDPNVRRYFGSNTDGVIYEHTASLAATMPDAGPPPAGHPVQ